MLLQKQASAGDGHRSTASPGSTPAQRKGHVLVVGGYGEVGQAVSRAVSALFPGRVVVAGRSGHRARALADQLGPGAAGLAFDVSTGGDSLDLSAIGVVVMCVDQPDTRFVEQCLTAGVDYVDITARQSSIDAIEGLDAVARLSESTVVLSVGLCPGVTNLLAARAAQQFDTLTKADIFLMLGSGDRHGQAAVEWTLANLDRPFDVFQDGQRRAVRGMREHETVQFPGDRYPRKAFRFNFPDQRTIVRTLGVPTVSTWLCFDSSFLTNVTRLLAPIVGQEAALPRLIRRGLARAIPGLRFGSDACHALVRVEGCMGQQTVVRDYSFSSRAEAQVTGIVAAETVRLLLEGERRSGIWHLEQLTSTGRFLERVRDTLPGTTLRV